MQPWEQREGEPALWFARFTRLRLLSPGERSYDAAYRAELATRETKGVKGRQKATAPRASRHWSHHAQQWDWEARIAAWDRHWLAVEASRIEAEKAEQRRIARENAAKHREQLIQAMSNPLLRAAANFKPEETSLSEMQKLFDAILNQSRLEFEPEPVRRLDVTTDGKGLPPGTFVLSLQSLAHLMQLGYLPQEFGNLFDRVIEEMAHGGNPLQP
ncbi:MAG: hypothetical protein DPW16_22130 [Chloroflexi bacterium]|nr:hypothetical protein [Chloroflexota bacterium]